MRFRDRTHAGRELAQKLSQMDLHQPMVLALPRGGVPVAFEVARSIAAPLDVFVARKVGAPHHPEFGIGAIAEGGGEVRDERSIAILGVSSEQWDQLVAREQQELERRIRQYRPDRALPDLEGRDVVLVDDGLATGVTAEASLSALHRGGARRVILAVPVCAPDTAERLSALADEVVCVDAPADFAAVGKWYENFGQTTDDEVLRLLDQARRDAND